MKKIDVLLVARPDHSFQIYKALLNQGVMSFRYYTFKVSRRLFSKIFHINRGNIVERDAVVNVLASVVSFIRSRFIIGFFEKYSDKYLMDKGTKVLLHRIEPRIIHYWPLYASDAVSEYMNKHPHTIALADVYCPNPAYLKERIKPILDSYGLPGEYLSDLRIVRNLEKAQSILVPSEYVADTFRVSLPDKEYIVVPYGITIYDERPQRIRHKTSAMKFVYVGTISVEKGCDILLDIFSERADLELHLFGGVHNQQKSIFLKYKEHSNIHFHGSIPKNDLQREICKFDVGIHLSRFDAYSIAVGEIIGCGIPVLVSDQTGIAGLVRNQQLGIVVPLVKESIIAAMDNMRDCGRYQQFVQNIESYIESRPPSYAENILELYRTLL